MKRSEYLKAMKLLRSSAKKLGVTIKFYRRPIKYPSHFGVNGGYSGKDKSITLTVYGNQSYSYIIAVLAHEVRHAEHDYLGLFKEYYDPAMNDIKDFAQKVVNKTLTLPSNSIALQAENDCNKFAINFMKKIKHPIKKSVKTYRPFFEPYPEHHTLVSTISNYIKYHL